MTDLTLYDVIRWIKGRPLNELMALMQELVNLMMQRVAGVVPVDQLMAPPPEPTSLPEIIDQTIAARGCFLVALAQEAGLSIPRMKEFSDGVGLPPTWDELQALSTVLIKISSSSWTPEELKLVVGYQYGGLPR